MIDLAYEDMKNHKGKVEDEEYKSIVSRYEQLSADFPKWRKVEKDEWLGVTSEILRDLGDLGGIPEPATRDQKLEAEMINISKTLFDDGRIPVKAIIKTADWAYDRDAFGNIIDRFHTAYIIFKMTDGTYRMVDIGFKQMYNGSTYGKTQSRGIGLTNMTVNYKP